MRLLITGVCGFVGSTLARELLAQQEGLEVFGIDNFIRPGSERNREWLRGLGVRLMHGDIREASDLEALPKLDWIIDAAANPSVLAGVDGRSGPRQLLEHNLWGTVNLLERSRLDGAGFTLLSTSRVYSIPPLASLEVEVRDGAFAPVGEGPGIGPSGVREDFSTAAPVSLYGASKLASETIALEYGASFDFPVWINRCGVLAGAGQFGRPDQGIFAYWIHTWKQRRPLRSIGFDGQGHQVRDCLHPADLAPLLRKQWERPSADAPRVIHASGGVASAMSLRQLSDWCRARFGDHEVGTEPQNRPFDIPWMVLDSGLAEKTWGWKPERPRDAILEEIAVHAEENPHWLDWSAPLG